MLAWFAGEQWRLDTFAEGGDIYCASASKMFGVPVVKHGVNGHLRQKGKIAELALGYGGAVGALTSMGALDMGMQEEELQPLVSQWRNSNPPYHKVLVGCGRSGSKGCEGADGGGSGKTVFYLPIRNLICHPSVWPEAVIYQAPNDPESVRSESLSYEGVGESKKVDAD